MDEGWWTPANAGAPGLTIRRRGRTPMRLHPVTLLAFLAAVLLPSMLQAQAQLASERF